MNLYESLSSVQHLKIYAVFIEQHCPQLKCGVCYRCCKFNAVHAAKTSEHKSKDFKMDIFMQKHGPSNVHFTGFQRDCTDDWTENWKLKLKTCQYTKNVAAFQLITQWCKKRTRNSATNIVGCSTEVRFHVWNKRQSWNPACLRVTIQGKHLITADSTSMWLLHYMRNFSWLWHSDGEVMSCRIICLEHWLTSYKTT